MKTRLNFTLLAGIALVALAGMALAQNASESRRATTATTAIPSASAQATPLADRFEAIDIYIDSGAAALAAVQVEVAAERGRIRIVGVEDGEVAALAGDHFYFDREVIDAGRSDRIILAAFSTAGRDELPTGRRRLATLHVYVEGGEVDYIARITAAANHEGEKITPKVTVEKGTD